MRAFEKICVAVLFGVGASVDMTKAQEAPKIFILASPPTSQVGLVFKGEYYWFDRQPPEEPCDLRVKGACYQKSDVKFKRISESIISINGGKASGCSPNIIP